MNRVERQIDGFKRSGEMRARDEETNRKVEKAAASGHKTLESMADKFEDRIAKEKMERAADRAEERMDTFRRINGPPADPMGDALKSIKESINGDKALEAADKMADRVKRAAEKGKDRQEKAVADAKGKSDK